MMKIDFFKDEQIVSDNYFGLCDDEDESSKTPAYVDTNPGNKDRWIADVRNISGKSIGFAAVDNKIEIIRDDGSMENRCDVMLHNDDYIIFVELKVQGKDWIKHAVEEQLQTTIDIFKSCHDIRQFRRRIAYACNKRHPAFAVSHKEYMQRFRKRNDVRLIIGCSILLKA